MDLSANIICQKSKFNCETSSGHINKLKHSPKRCDSKLSNAPKNINNGKELVENKIIRYTTPPASLLKNPKLNCKANTGHIYKVQNRPKRCNSKLSNAPKNAENGPESVEK